MDLTEAVKKFRIVYEVTKAEQIVDDERRAIGFDLTLCGAHPEGTESVDPSATEAGEARRAMEAIARAILPTEEGACHFSIRGFDHALHLAPAREFRSDVELVIEVRHRDGYLESIDERERECLEQMQHRLEGLGIPQGRWS